MKISKLYIVLVIFMTIFSCKKDRLKGEVDIFVGEWKLEKTIFRGRSRGGGCWVDTLVRNCDITLIIKKSGRVSLIVNGEKEKFLISYDKSHLDDNFLGGNNWTEQEPLKFGCSANDITNSKFSYLGLKFYSKIDDREYNPGCYVNDSELILKTDDDNKIIDGFSSNPISTYYRFWKRVN